MKLIVGLGNPGAKYYNTRHNLGFMVTDELLNSCAGVWQKFSSLSQICSLIIDQQKVVLLQPQTFMNDSGKSVKEIAQFYKIDPDDIWVIHDDLDLPFSTIRLSYDSSAAGHKGVQSIIDELGSQKFWRYRMGIDQPPQNIPTENFVLETFTTNEQTSLTKLISLTQETVRQSLKNGISELTTAINKTTLTKGGINS